MDAPGRHRTGGADQEWMDMALRLAKKGLGATSPNPMVGAVVVSAQGELAGSGWHRGPRNPHAEALALEEAGDRARGGTIFVNLEPCVHHGQTPPCVKALLAAGVARVVCGLEDPDPRVAGKGFKALRRAGVQVDVGLQQAEAADLNRAYLSHRSKHRPFVTLKIAASLDGRTSAADGSSKWITGEKARLDGHRERGLSDAICVGIGTILSDDPLLAPRTTVNKQRLRAPLRVVVDSRARTPPGARVLDASAPTLLVVAEGGEKGRPQGAMQKRLANLQRAGAEVARIPAGPGGVALPALTALLAERGVMSLLLEGGPKLAGSFFREGLVDRYLFYLAPKLLGAPGTGSAIEGWAAETISRAAELQKSSFRKLGADLRIEAFPAAGQG